MTIMNKICRDLLHVCPSNRKNPTGLFFIISSLILSSAFSSCRFEDEDYFDESAAQRIETITGSIKQTLVGAPNGWVMQYFTGSEDIEGFNIFVRFDDNNKVTMASDHRFLRDGNAGKYTEYASIYELLKEDGPVLAFNTWNDILTPFVDPVDPSAAPNNLVKDGEGMKGDHNFVVLSYGSDEVLLRGERHSARVRLVPCENSWDDYMQGTSSLKNYYATTTITNYYVTNGTDTLYFKNLRKGVITYCERIDDPLFPTTVNCVFTPNGFRLHHANDIKGTKFQEFHMAADSTCLLSEDDSVKVIALWDNYIVNARNTTWNFDLEQLTAEQKALVAQIDDEIKSFNKSYSLASIGLGRSTGKNAVKGLVITYYTNTAKTKTNSTGLALNTFRPAFGQMQIDYDESCVVDGNMEAFAKKTNLETIVRQLGTSFIGVYDIKPDNYFLPTCCELQTLGGGQTYSLK